MANFSPGDPSFQALQALRPLLRAESARGNSGALYRGDPRDGRASYRLRFPIDLDAIKAEFELGSGIELDATGGGRIKFVGRDESPAFVIAGGTRMEWPWTPVRRRLWWRRYRRGDIPRTAFENPFRELVA